jgi:hypothetical protein
MENIRPITMGTKAVFISSCTINAKALFSILEEA